MTTKNYKNNQNLLFEIDNTFHLIKERLFWLIWFILFMFFLLEMFIHTESNIGKSLNELFYEALQGKRFIILLIILFIIAPIDTIIKTRKILNADNHILINQKEIEYQNNHIPLSEIQEIKIGCCIVKGDFKNYILVYVLFSIFTLPLVVFDFIFFYILKFLKYNNIGTFSNKFIISFYNSKPIVGTIYSQKDYINIVHFIKQVHSFQLSRVGMHTQLKP